MRMTSILTQGTSQIDESSSIDSRPMVSLMGWWSSKSLEYFVYLLTSCSTEGNLWNAVYGTHRVMVFSPKGDHLKNIVFGARNITCTTWGGRNYDILFLTTASDQSKNARPEDEGGNIFQCRIEGVKGKPKYECAG